MIRHPNLTDDWRFMKYDSAEEADDLIYDVRTEVLDTKDDKPADSKPTEAMVVEADRQVLKPWIMPTGNCFLKDSTEHYVRSEGNPGEDFPFVQTSFDDSAWKEVDLAHDWIIEGPFWKDGMLR